MLQQASETTWLSDGAKWQSRRFVINRKLYSVWYNRFSGSPARCGDETSAASRRDASALGVNIGDSQHSTSVCGRGRAKATDGSTCIMTRLQPFTAARELCAMHRCGRGNRGKANSRHMHFALRSAPMHLSRVEVRAVSRPFFTTKTWTSFLRIPNVIKYLHAFIFNVTCILNLYNIFFIYYSYKLF